MQVQGFHYPFPSLAHVEKYGTGYREIPVIWNPAIWSLQAVSARQRSRKPEPANTGALLYAGGCSRSDRVAWL